MSMSEFNKQEDTEESSSLSVEQSLIPDDFSTDDLAFTTELHALFSPEEENLPPYYVQTLLDVDDQRFEPVSHEFEQKTCAHVFRRLKLRRRLFYPHPVPFHVLNMRIGDALVRRSTLAVASTFALIIFLTVAFTGASFASGVAILLHHTHKNGVYMMEKYPAGKVQPALVGSQDIGSSTRQISLFQAQSKAHFRIYVPGFVPSSYLLAHINLYVNLEQQWTDGPMLEFEFSLPPSAAPHKGAGEIWVREFKPRADALQLVEQGAATPLEVDNNGEAQAIYVDGEWASRGKGIPQWVYGGRSELIYQENGIVFWIVGDRRDGIAEPQLMQVAQGLVPAHFNQEYRVLNGSISVTQMSEDMPGPFSNDVIVVYPDDSNSGPYFVAVSSYQPPKNVR